jgi:hypothetical protein
MYSKTIVNTWNSWNSWNMLFLTFLVDKKLKAELKLANNAKESCSFEGNCKIWYIENIIGTQLADHRKFIIRLILAPYFVNVQKLTYAESFRRIKDGF